MDWRKCGVTAVLGLAAWLGGSAPARAEQREYRIGEFSPEFRATLSGCCWHQFSTFDVVQHAPRLLEETEEALEPASPAYLRRETRGQRASTEHLLLPAEESGSKLLLGFDLAGSTQKRIELFVTEGVLDYALVVGPERRVEFSYQLHVLGPSGERPKARPFTWNAATSELSFQNGAYRYVIHDGAQGPSVSVHFRGKVVSLPGVEQSRRGTLQGWRFGISRTSASRSGWDSQVWQAPCARGFGERRFLTGSPQVRQLLRITSRGSRKG